MRSVVRRSISGWLVCLLCGGVQAAEGPARDEFLSSFGVDATQFQSFQTARNPAKEGLATAARASQSLNPMAAIVLPEEEDNEVRTARARSTGELDLMQSTAAVRQIEQGQYGAAQASLEAYLRETPGAHESRKTLATILMARGEEASAREILESGLKLAPNFGPFKKLYARLLLRDEAERAVALLERVPPDLRIDSEYHEIYAAALQLSAQFEASSLVYKALLQLDDHNATWWMGLAISRDAVGDFEEAESAYAMASHFGARNLVLNQYGEARLNALRGQR